jgi:hypothetical protein
MFDVAVSYVNWIDMAVENVADRAETRLCSFTGVINRHRGSDCALGAGDQV